MEEGEPISARRICLQKELSQADGMESSFDLSTAPLEWRGCFILSNLDGTHEEVPATEWAIVHARRIEPFHNAYPAEHMLANRTDGRDQRLSPADGTHFDGRPAVGTRSVRIFQTGGQELLSGRKLKGWWRHLRFAWTVRRGCGGYQLLLV